MTDRVQKFCSQCDALLDADDARVHVYVEICRVCFGRWDAEILAAVGVRPHRYGWVAKTRKYPPIVCYPCGLAFRNTPALHVHRTGGRCQPPSVMFERGMSLDDKGIWALVDCPTVLRYPSKSRRKYRPERPLLPIAKIYRRLDVDSV